MKLKTLKDLEGNGILANNDFVLDYDEDGERGYVLYDNPVPILRQEAIKQLKMLRKKRLELTALNNRFEIGWNEGRQQFIEEFFDLTEEDLK